jgi:multidrug efflux pump subunit AcrB
MGPYMRPIPVGASVAMIFSLAVAFIATPYLAIRLLGKHAAPARPSGAPIENETEAVPSGRVARWYRRQVEGLLRNRPRRLGVYAAVVGLLLV